MRFSIIVPIYKVQNYLDECISSVLKQTYLDYELILVDDGSPDECGRICDMYADRDPRIKVIHKENGGLSDARNYGTRAARGDYIVFVDGDDYIGSSRFLESLDGASKNAPDIILYKYRKYYEDAKTFSGVGFHIPQIDIEEEPGDVVEKLVRCDAFYSAAWMKAIKRSLLTDHEIEFKKGILSEDQEWYYHVVLCAKTYAAIDEAFIVYRQRSGSITTTVGRKNLQDTLALLNYWTKEIPNTGASEKLKNALMNSLARQYSNLIIALSSLNITEQKEFYGPMKELDWLLRYRMCTRTRRIGLIYKLSGIRGAAWILGKVSKLRKK